MKYFLLRHTNQNKYIFLDVYWRCKFHMKYTLMREPRLNVPCNGIHESSVPNNVGSYKIKIITKCRQVEWEERPTVACEFCHRPICCLMSWQSVHVTNRRLKCTTMRITLIWYIALLEFPLTFSKIRNTRVHTWHCVDSDTLRYPVYNSGLLYIYRIVGYCTMHAWLGTI